MVRESLLDRPISPDEIGKNRLTVKEKPKLLIFNCISKPNKKI